MAEGKRITVFFDRTECEFIGLSQDRIDELKLAFPGVNILSELISMKDWLMSPKGKYRAGSMRFITNWLAQAPIAPSAVTPIDSRLQPLVSSYLEELWSKNSHIMALNKAI